MNILIVGNGFDLSHYLPTKYDHFMVAMAAIESWDESKGDMGFDDLFRELYEKEDYFFGYTKAIYQTEEIKISVDEIEKLQKQLKENVWYQYFSDHVKEIKTWIDFESKINEALRVIANFIVKLENNIDKHGYFDYRICFHRHSDPNQIFLIRQHCNLLENLGVLASGYYLDDADYDENGEYTIPVDFKDPEIGDFRFYINQNYISNHSGAVSLNSEELFNLLQIKLDDFIELFNFYLEEVVKKLKPKNQFNPLKSDKYDLTEIDQIYSFNYTQTYLDFYSSSTKIDFLHGRSGKNQNMVLGISELEDDVLKKIKAYGFTKYHQKLMKGTDYGFLNHNEKFDNLVNPSGMRTGEVIQINIWGHSLDVSDEDYIQEIFSFNQNEDQYVRITVFYFNRTAKFSLLANLLHILGKEKVEYWMKQGWLKFEENLKVVQLNEIQPVELPKHES